MLALLLAVGLIAAGVTVVTRRAFDELNREHTDALLAQFQREFARRGSEVVESVKGIADAEPTVRMAIDLSRPNADVSVYVNDAHGVSKSHQLDLLDFVNNDGTIISSQESPARFNYKMDWVTQAGGLAGARRVSHETRYGIGSGAGAAVGGDGASGRPGFVRGGRRTAGQGFSGVAGAAGGICARCCI